MFNQLKDIFRGYDIRMEGENIRIEKSNKIIFLSRDEEVNNIIDFYKTSENTVYFIPKHENLIFLNNPSIFEGGFVFSIKLSYIKKIIRKRKIKKLRNEKI